MDDAEEFGLLGLALVALALFPLIVFTATVAGVGYLVFLAVRGIGRWLSDRPLRRMDPALLIERDYQQIRAAMNEAAGASWRNLAD